MIGRGAGAAKDKLLTMAPFERFSSGKKARVTLNNPSRLTARCCSMTSELPNAPATWRGSCQVGQLGTVDRKPELVKFPCRS